jgi:hypothetical protein
LSGWFFYLAQVMLEFDHSEAKEKEVMAFVAGMCCSNLFKNVKDHKSFTFSMRLRGLSKFDLSTIRPTRDPP